MLWEATLRPRLSLISALFLALWGIRLHTLQSAFQCDDSPETATAGALPGIQHPPGYPLPTLAGRLATLGLPGNPALSQNMAASFWACLSAVLFFLILLQLTGDLHLAFMLALALGLMPQLAYQASSAKGGIYTLNLFITLASLSCFWLGQKFGDKRYFILGYLCFGFGLSGHYMSLVLFLPAAWLWTREAPKKYLLWLLPGLSLYLYLPLRAMQKPALNWGDPSNLERLIQVLSRDQYSGQGGEHNLQGILRLVGHFFGMIPGQLLLPLILTAPLGLWLAWRSRSWQLRPLIYSSAIHFAAVLIVNNPPARAPWVADAFFLPDFVLLWFFGALGLWSLFLRWPEKRRDLLIGLGILVLGLSPIQYKKVDYSNDTLAYDYARDLQNLLPKDAVLLGAGGGDAFGFWYLQDVEGRRRDLTLVDVPLLSSWYLQELAPRIPELKPEWNTQALVVNGLLASTMRKPLYYTTHNPGDRGIPLALVSLAPSPNRQVQLSAPILMAPWKTLRLRFLNDQRTPVEGNRKELLAYYPASARALADFGRRFQSAELIQFSDRLQRQFSEKP